MQTRRTFLSDVGMGFTGLALSALLQRDGLAREGTPPGLHFPAKAKKVIWLFMVGGTSHVEISDWWPNVAAHADRLAVVRSLWTTDNDHGAQLQFHTGRHVLDGPQPTIGSWIHYGLGSLNDNLPSFVVLGTPLADCCGGVHG